MAGTGSHSARKEIIGSKVENGLFESISANVNDAGDKFMTATCQDVNRALAKVLNKIVADFHVAYASATTDDKWNVWQQEMDAIKGGVADIGS